MNKTNSSYPSVAPHCEGSVLFAGEKIRSPLKVNETENLLLRMSERAVKATGSEIAAFMGFTCADTIELLLHLEKIGLVAQLNGYWMLPTDEIFLPKRNVNESRKVIIRRSKLSTARQ